MSRRHDRTAALARTARRQAALRRPELRDGAGGHAPVSFAAAPGSSGPRVKVLDPALRALIDAAVARSRQGTG